MTDRLAHRTALVTGSTSGIGRAIAEAFADEGAHVLVTGRRAELGAEVVAGIVERGGRAEFIPADLAAGTDAVVRFADTALAAAGGRIDVLVNNAAYLVGGTPTLDTDPAVIDAALDLNVKVPFLITARLIPAMVDAGSGAIINIGSINGTSGMVGAALYSATKGATHMLTRAWAAEFGRSGISVNTIAPGPTAVEWNESMRDRLVDMVGGTPSGRLSRASEVAALAVLLASDEARNIQGATIPVDGGMANVAYAATS
jgi:NAD(P)-dependent dehydrogenase (short-subunit alcohol dehydrogenase family)